MMAETTTLNRSSSLARRGVARLIDAVIVAVMACAIGVATGFGIGWLIGASVGIYVYFVAFDLTGSTPGKRLCGLRVHTSGDDGRPPTIGQASRRELFVLIGAVPFAGPVAAIAAWLTIARGIRSRGRGWHDRIALTAVSARCRPRPSIRAGAAQPTEGGAAWPRTDCNTASASISSGSPIVIRQSYDETTM